MTILDLTIIVGAGFLVAFAVWEWMMEKVRRDG